MLKLAYPYQDAINVAWQTCVFQEKYQFYNVGNWWEYKIELDHGSWNNIQMVSVGASGQILGYFGACIDRLSNKVSNIGAINFGEVNFVFSMDFYQFLTELFTKHRFRKVEWVVVVGNPAERIYDKIIAKYGGRVVGIRRDSVITSDGVMRDEKEYELFLEDYYSKTGSSGLGSLGRKQPKQKKQYERGTENGHQNTDCTIRGGA